jgi:succinate dehydrogenase subunit C
MNPPPTAYTEYHPRWYRSPVSAYWWLRRGTYLAFILREISSVFVAWAVVYLLLLVRAVSRGEAAYREFLAWSASPGMWLLNLVTLFFLTFHAVTWFNLAPQAMVVHAGGKRVPGVWIAASNYVLWAVVTALVVWIILG